MPRIIETFVTELALADVHGYLRDFANLPEWDPTVARAEVLTPDEDSVGRRVRIHLGNGAVAVPLVYRIVLDDGATHVRLQTESALVAGVDDIRLRALDDASTEVTWTADFGLRGPASLFDPFLTPAFRRLGTTVVASLEDVLTERARDQRTG